MLRSGSDEVLYRINPVQVATQKSIIRRTSHLALQASAPLDSLFERVLPPRHNPYDVFERRAAVALDFRPAAKKLCTRI